MACPPDAALATWPCALDTSPPGAREDAAAPALCEDEPFAPPPAAPPTAMSVWRS